jgi:hypothetical protein
MGVAKPELEIMHARRISQEMPASPPMAAAGIVMAK